MMKLRKILVPIDFSKEAELALEWAVRLANEQKESTVYLLHILSPMPTMEGGFEIDAILKGQWEDAMKRTEEWRRKIPPPLSSVVRVAQGDPVGKITSMIEKEDIDLVVMSTQGRQGFPRLAHPNLSEKVVRNASCPVLVLHLNAKAAALAN